MRKASQVRSGLAALAAAVLLFVQPASGQVPPTIHYQGYLTNPAGQPVSGNLDIVGRIYDQPSGGTGLFSETHSAVANGDLKAAKCANAFCAPYFRRR